MKIAGIIILIFGSLSFIGAASRGNGVFGPLFWVGLGVFMIYRANQKKREKEEKDKWNNNE